MLDDVVHFWSDGYVSDRQILGTNGKPSFGATPNDSNNFVDSTIVTPSNLDTTLKTYFIKSDFIYNSFENRTTDSGVKFKVESKVEWQRYNEVNEDRIGGVINIPFGTVIGDIVKDQGYYLVVESDIAGNRDSYYVYVDKEAPTLVARVTKGNGEYVPDDIGKYGYVIDEKLLVINKEFIDMYNGSLYYLSFEVQSIVDNLDPYYTLVVSGRNMQNVTYVQGDDIDLVLGSEGYYGKYSFLMYDRSGNSLEWDMNIAGDEPSLTHSSLSETSSRLILTFNTPNSMTQITDISIYKVDYEGERTRLDTDSEGLSINTASLRYIFLDGGKYQAEYEDIFGRYFVSEQMMFLKGMPYGTLSGAKDLGFTNKSVSVMLI